LEPEPPDIRPQARERVWFATFARSPCRRRGRPFRRRAGGCCKPEITGSIPVRSTSAAMVRLRTVDTFAERPFTGSPAGRRAGSVPETDTGLRPAGMEDTLQL
jgi:hypothetical protein